MDKETAGEVSTTLFIIGILLIIVASFFTEALRGLIWFTPPHLIPVESFLFGGVGIILIFIGTYVYLTKAR